MEVRGGGTLELLTGATVPLLPFDGGFAGLGTTEPGAERLAADSASVLPVTGLIPVDIKDFSAGKLPLDGGEAVIDADATIARVDGGSGTAPAGITDAGVGGIWGFTTPDSTGGECRKRKTTPDKLDPTMIPATIGKPSDAQLDLIGATFIGARAPFGRADKSRRAERSSRID